MITLRPVLEVYPWTVSPSGRSPPPSLPLHGALGPTEVGTVVMGIAARNDTDPATDGRPARPADPPTRRPADPLESFLHGLLTMDPLFAGGGLRVTDTTTGATPLPGRCNGPEERGDWLAVVDGAGLASFGHAPSPMAERLGDVARLTVDTEQDDNPVIELPAPELRHLPRRGTRPARLPPPGHGLDHPPPPDHAALVSAAIARALALGAPGVPPKA
ncbi:hypothetical protein [Streptomyces sp. SAJ15]|uniref:hypothetical protein n=1 Tax=Streptomyces sp. SAJ15 TaxID=2011095 RepID=UPI0021B378E2|nr:hypothetical protein [Streptomyces sp. SAJ15]